jgi:tetratricopeptide (TPR) repeat protein
VRFYISSLGLMLALVAVAFSQRVSSALTDTAPYAPERSGIVRGHISSDTAVSGSLTVELVAVGTGVSTSAAVDASGWFDLQGLAPGQYQLRLASAGGQVVHEEEVYIAGGNQYLSIRAAGSQSLGKPDEPTVSIHQLQHRIPTRAQKEFDKGRAALDKGDQPTALGHFLKATEMDPEFADAFNCAGVVFLTGGELEHAAHQFQKAIDLVPDHRSALANMSVALSRLEQPHEAAAIARRALKLDPGLVKVRYVLGLSLIKDGGDKSEALDNLQRAAADIPKAHLLVAKILADSGQREKAAEHVEEYLLSRPVDGIDRQRVEAWLVRLRQ